MPLTSQQLREFVQSHAISSDESRLLVARATAATYWESIAPRLTVSQARPVSEFGGASNDVSEPVGEYRRCGFCTSDDVFAVHRLAELEEAVMAVHRAGWPMVFAFVFDQFWTLLQAPKLERFITELVGTAYQTTPRFWANYVSPTAGGAGFLPHVDGGDDHTVTCWVPLTRASADNGCIYVVERSPASRALIAQFRELNAFSRQQMSILLSHSRALPLRPGGFAAWPQDTIHWGGMFRRGAARLALSWEFTSVAQGQTDSALSVALSPDRPLPAFEDRLRWICQSLLKFRGREMILERYVPVVRQILAEAEAG